AFAVWVFSGAIRSFSRSLAVGVVGVLVSAIWLFPLLVNLRYTTNMRYGPLGLDAPDGQAFTDYLFPKYFFSFEHWEPYHWGAYILIAVAIVGGVAFLRRSTFTVLVLTGLCGLAFRYWTDLGSHVWNLRVLSFWYLGLHLLMAIGVAELVRSVGWLVGEGPHLLRRDASTRPGASGATGASGVTGVGGTPGESEVVSPGMAAVRAELDVPVAATEAEFPGRMIWDEQRRDWVKAGSTAPIAPETPPESTEPAAAPSDDVVGALAEASIGDDPALVRARRGETLGRAVSLVVMIALTVALSIGALVDIDGAKSFLPYWAKWNFSGYENTKNEVTGSTRSPCTGGGAVTTDAGTGATAAPALCNYPTTVALAKQWPEYRALMNTLGALPPGRAVWEGGSDLDKYGTPDSLMLIPFWTHGRIESMEGLYYEASATTPYLFEAEAALDSPGQASNPVRGIPYRDQSDFSIGVDYLQTLGVNYFIAQTGTAKARADLDPRLTLVATSPDLDQQAPLGWSIYRVADSPRVTGLAFEPVVATGVDPGPEGWEQQVAVPWFWYPAQLATPVSSDGPATWSRAPGSRALTLPRTPITPIVVTRIHRSRDSISFHVDRTGSPVLVKESWFPNWKVDGAAGPYRTTPNYMVVVPTSHDVTLFYGTTGTEWLGRVASLLGLVGLVLLGLWGRRTRRREGSPGAG
ncbi:MAG: hypothetical protein WCI50_11710, partial [Actinomycetes bacterium]